MKTQVIRHFLAMIILFSGVACEKVTEELKTEDEIQSVENTIKALVEQAENQYLKGEVISEESNENSVPGSDGLTDTYTADEKGLEGTSTRNTLHNCVRSVEPDREQRLKLRRAFTAYSARNARVINAHRERIQILQERLIATRDKLNSSLEAGDITREQYRQRIQILREHYQESVLRIRASNVEAFSRSYAIMLEHLQHIFTEEQGKMFTDCMAS